MTLSWQFKLGVCAFMAGVFALVAADFIMNKPNMPAVPAYPHATLLKKVESKSWEPTIPWTEAIYTTADTAADVQLYYEKTLWDNGWSKSPCGFYESQRSYILELNVRSENEGTTISISAGPGKFSCDRW